MGGRSPDYKKLAGPEIEVVGVVGTSGGHSAGEPRMMSCLHYIVFDHPNMPSDCEEYRAVLAGLCGQHQLTEFNGTRLLVKGKVTPEPNWGNRPKLAIGWVRELGPRDEDWRSPWPMNLQLLPSPEAGPIAWVAACEATDPADSQLGYSGVQNVRQRFKVLEVFLGDVMNSGQAIEMAYSYLVPGFLVSGRDVVQGERLIWVGGDSH